MAKKKAKTAQKKTGSAAKAKPSKAPAKAGPKTPTPPLRSKAPAKPAKNDTHAPAQVKAKTTKRAEKAARPVKPVASASTATEIAKPNEPRAKQTPRKPKVSKPAVLEPTGRPASKPHVHPAGDDPQILPGRVRKDASGPTHNGIGDAAVRKATGQGWAEWFSVLDEAAAAKMAHADIATFLTEKHGVAAWWAQSVTVGYEQARGLRQKNETPDGFQAGVSKTINAATAKLYHAWEDEAARTRWMGDHKLEIRVANAEKNIRMTWLGQGPDEGSSVEVSFWPKDANKCLVQVQQRKLADAEAVQRVRAFWSVKLENLRAAMEKA